jgi:hypothetical protein
LQHFKITKEQATSDGLLLNFTYAPVKRQSA